MCVHLICAPSSLSLSLSASSSLTLTLALSLLRCLFLPVSRSLICLLPRVMSLSLHGGVSVCHCCFWSLSVLLFFPRSSLCPLTCPPPSPRLWITGSKKWFVQLLLFSSCATRTFLSCSPPCSLSLSSHLCQFLLLSSSSFLLPLGHPPLTLQGAVTSDLCDSHPLLRSGLRVWMSAWRRKWVSRLVLLACNIVRVFVCMLRAGRVLVKRERKKWGCSVCCVCVCVTNTGACSAE